MVDRIPGLIAVVDEDNHNVYPVVGIAYQGCHQRAQTVQAHTYVSAVAPQGTLANRNLQGYDTLKPVRQDCTAVLHDMGFGDGALPRTIANTGINYNALKVVSNILARTDTFNLAEVDVFTIPSTGSLAQIIETIPTRETVDVETLFLALVRKRVVLVFFRRFWCGVFGLVQRDGQHERRLRVVLFRRRFVKWKDEHIGTKGVFF